MKTAQAQFTAKCCLIVACLAPICCAAAEAPERIDEALGEQADPLDRAAFGIEQGEYAGAEEFLERYINAIESARHRYDPDLVEPLTLLGDASLGQQRFDKALDYFSRALHIRRVNDGLFAPGQVEVVYKQAEALQAMGDVEEAGNREEYAYSVLQKAHGPLSELVLPGTYRLADWYRQNHNVFAARALYERAMRIHEAIGEQNTPSTLPALKGIVYTYREERFPPYYVGNRRQRSLDTMPLTSRATVYSETISINNFPAAERALQHIVHIRREDPESTPLQLCEAILELADWHLLWEHFRKAHTLYEFVYAQLDKLESIDASAYFGEPKLLHIPLPADPKAPRIKDADADEPRVKTQGFIEASFRVSANGGAQDIEIVVSEPEGLMDFRTRRSVRSARYRPTMADGKAVPFENQTWRHEFEYVAQEDDAEAADA